MAMRVKIGVTYSVKKRQIPKSGQIKHQSLELAADYVRSNLNYLTEALFEWMIDISAISDLKLRASVAVLSVNIDYQDEDHVF